MELVNNDKIQANWYWSQCVLHFQMLGIFCDIFLNIFILSDPHQMTDDVYRCKAWVEKESLHIADLDLWKPVRQMIQEA